MSTPDPHAEPPPAEPPPAEPSPAEPPRMLTELGGMTMDTARGSHRLAMLAIARDTAIYEAAAAACPTGEPPGPLAQRATSPGLLLGYARAAGAAREIAALQVKTLSADRADAAGRRQSGGARRRLNRMKEEVRREVENTIRANAKPADVRRLMFDLDARLDDPDVEAAFETLTQGQMVLSVCDDLGVEPDLTTWSVEMLREAYAAVFPDRPLPESLVERQHVLNGGLTKGPPVEKLPTGFIGSPGVPSALEMMGGLPAQTGAAPATAPEPLPDAPAREEPLPPGYRRLGAMVFEPDGAALPRGAQAPPQPRPSDAAAPGDASTGRLRNRLGGVLSR